jgi:hypothetical protein
MNLISKFKGQTTPVCKFMGVFAPGRQVYGCPMYLTLSKTWPSSEKENAAFPGDKVIASSGCITVGYKLIVRTMLSGPTSPLPVARRIPDIIV